MTRKEEAEREREQDLLQERARLTTLHFATRRIREHAGHLFAEGGHDDEARALRDVAETFASDIASSEAMLKALSDPKRYAAMMQLGRAAGGGGR